MKEKFQIWNDNTLVLEFVHERTLVGDAYSEIKIVTENQLPFRLKHICDDSYLHDWISRRSVPVNRHHMEAMLGALNLKEPFDVMCYSHALSLNDTYWMQEESEGLHFDDINLYENKFDEALGWIAFTGLPSNISRNLSTPELTTVGVLPKYWQRIGKDDIILCKGGTSGYSNAGYEPYREVVAYLVSKILKLPAVAYHLERRNDKIVSISPLFTTREVGITTASEYLDYKYPNLRTKRFISFLEVAKEDGIDLYNFYLMCLLDYIIENNDRHLNNWAISVDNRTRTLQGISTVWDNGAGLDYTKPKDMRDALDFSSFGIKYDFVKDCPYTKEFRGLVYDILTAINSGKLEQEAWEATNKYYPSEELLKGTMQLLEERCNEFLKP